MKPNRLLNLLQSKRIEMSTNIQDQMLKQNFWDYLAIQNDEWIWERTGLKII